MRRLRSQGGQASVEYLGVLVFVAVIIAAIAAADLDAQIATGVEEQICVVLGDDDASCATESPGNQPPPDESSQAPTLSPAPIESDGEGSTQLISSVEPPGYDCFEPYVSPESRAAGVPLSPCQQRFEAERRGAEVLDPDEANEQSLEVLEEIVDFLRPRPEDIPPALGGLFGGDVGKFLDKITDAIGGGKARGLKKTLGGIFDRIKQKVDDVVGGSKPKRRGDREPEGGGAPDPALNPKPNPSQRQLDKYREQLSNNGEGSLRKSRRSLEKRLEEHRVKLEQIRRSGGPSSSVEREIRNFTNEIEAIDRILGGP